MRRNAVLVVMTLILLALAGCGKQQGAASFIGADQAKQLALDACEMTVADTESVTADLVTRDGQDCYRIDITAAGQRYQLDIDASTGAIVGVGVPGGTESREEQSAPEPSVSDPTVESSTETGAASESSAAAETSATVESSTETGAASESASGTAEEMIAIEDARASALAHAGFTADQVTFVEGRLDYEDGRRVYEIEFYSGDYREYDYEIDAYTGEVVSFDHDAEYYVPAQSADSVITADEAKKLALEKVPGASESDIREFEVDRDDGRIEYEGKIVYNGIEYEFEIDGSGQILSWEEESARGR